MKKIILIITLSIILAPSLYSQEQTVGVQLGVLNSNFLDSYSIKNYSSLLFGVKYEYSPKLVFVSVSGSIQYTQNVFLTPITLNLKLGKKLKFLVSGGVMPVFRFWNLGIQKNVELGGIWHVGLEYKVSKSFSIYGTYGDHIIPVKYEHPNHFGGSTIYQEIEYLHSILIGVNYIIPKVVK